MSPTKKINNTLNDYPITFKELEVIEVALKVYRDVIVDSVNSGEAEDHNLSLSMSLLLELLAETAAIVTNALDDREARHLLGNNLTDKALENFMIKQVAFDE